MNVIANTAEPALAPWQVSFCDRYAILMLEYGRWFLLAALLVGLASAIVALIAAYKLPKKDGESGGAAAINTAIDAIKGLIEALSKAPTWLAMLGAALLLLWMAGNAVPNYCLIGATNDRENASNNAADNVTADNAADNSAEAANGSESGGK